MKALMNAAGAGAGLMTAIPASAQSSVTATTTETTGSITIAPEQRTVIQQRLGSAKPVKEKVTVGMAVPDTIELQTVPDTIVSDIPAVKGYSYFVYNDDVVFAAPKTRKVVTIVE